LSAAEKRPSATICSHGEAISQIITKEKAAQLYVDLLGQSPSKDPYETSAAFAKRANTWLAEFEQRRGTPFVVITVGPVPDLYEADEGLLWLGTYTSMGKTKFPSRAMFSDTIYELMCGRFSATTISHHLEASSEVVGSTALGVTKTISRRDFTELEIALSGGGKLAAWPQKGLVNLKMPAEEAKAAHTNVASWSPGNFLLHSERLGSS
jgi:hypothetical protein